MPEIFYIADTHFGHKNIIGFDNRPFTDVEDMEERMVENWNQKVKAEDRVYILGDFSWLNQEESARVAKRLNGEKHLVLGNHDKNITGTARKQFAQIAESIEVSDKDRVVILSHYPQPFYKHDYMRNTYMLYGHVHITYEHHMMEKVRRLIHKIDDRLPESRNRCQFYNCWCGFYGYAPATLDEITAYWKHLLEEQDMYEFAVNASRVDPANAITSEEINNIWKNG